MNYQNWRGTEDPRFGYGAMLDNFRSAVPAGVTLDSRASVEIYMGVPRYIGRWTKGSYKVLYTMWETDELREDFVRWLPKFEQILVPCQENVDLFSQHHSSVTHVPIGIDTKFWKPVHKERDGKFRFHAGGSLWRRKGLDLLVEAFRLAKIPDAELHIKVAPHAHDVPSRIGVENVFLHRNWMSREQQRDWYSLADCFVAPARGEGFGLMPLQAIAMGIPTIITATSGQSQYKDLATGVVGHTKVKADSVGFWDEAIMDELVHEMIFHYQTDQRAMATANAKEVKRFSTQSAAKKLVASVPEGTLLENPTIEEAYVLVDMEVTKKCACETNGRMQQFVPGVTYQVTEDTYEVMYPSGYIKENK